MAWNVIIYRKGRPALLYSGVTSGDVRTSAQVLNIGPYAHSTAEVERVEVSGLIRDVTIPLGRASHSA